jgi:hypothetical protein
MASGEEETFPEDTREAFREGRWLSYDELGQIRGIGRASAVKLAQREKWQRRAGNDRTARVLVPLEWLKPARRQSETFREEFPEGFPEFSRIVSALEAAIAASKERSEADAATISTLREQLERANAQAEEERNRADRAETRADKAEQGRDAERARADALADRAHVMQADLATAKPREMPSRSRPPS